MDPLSISVGVVTLLQAVKSIQKRISAARHAPQEVKLLEQELNSLQNLLQQVENAAPTQTEDGNAKSLSGKATGLNLQMTQLSGKLKEFEQLLHEYKPRAVPTRFGVDRPHLDWWQAGQRAESAKKLRADANVLRLNLTASLGAVSLTRFDDVELAVKEGISHQVEIKELLRKSDSQQEETTKLLEKVVKHFDTCPHLHLPKFQVTSDGVDCSFNVPVTGPAEVPSTESGSSIATMTRRRPNRPSATNKSDLGLYANMAKAHCKEWCSCSCHKKNVIKLKQPFHSNKGGYLTVSYRGLPWITAECDEKKTCSSRSLPYVATTIHFPTWFWKRYISTSLTYNSLDGSNFFLKAPRTVDWTPKLWKFAQEGNIPAVRDLFARRAGSPLIVSPIGGSALHFAAGNKHLELCKFLVTEGALADHEDDFKNSGTSLAWDHYLSNNLTKEDQDIVTTVFNDSEYIESRQFTILHKIVLGLIPKSLQDELNYSTKGIDAVDSSGRTCVSWAAGRGDAEKLKVLLDCGANPHIPDIRGSTALHHVANLACCELLIDHDADVFARNEFGHTTLISLTRTKDCVPVLERLVKANVDVNARDKADETALCNGFVALAKLTDTARFLLDNNADINAATDHKDTILNFAVQHNAHDILRLLFERDVEYTLTTVYEQTILHKAARMADAQTISILQQHDLSKLDVAALDHEGKSAMDYVNERDTDSMESDLREKFEELYRSILSSQLPSLTTQMAALDMSGGLSKTPSVTCLTPLTIEDDVAGNEDAESLCTENELEHGTAVFYDAFEQLEDTAPVQIAV